MAEIRKVGSPVVLSALTLAANRIEGSAAGEDIAAGDACYVAGDGRIRRSIAGDAAEAADVRGFAVAAARTGEAVTLAFDVTMRFGENLPRGESLYLSAVVAGGLADSPASGSTEPVAFVVDATCIRALQS